MNSWDDKNFVAAVARTTPKAPVPYAAPHRHKLEQFLTEPLLPSTVVSRIPPDPTGGA
jgi:hypothetical protein